MTDPAALKVASANAYGMEVMGFRHDNRVWAKLVTADMTTDMKTAGQQQGLRLGR
jgi:hypothetical protein